MLQQVCEYIHNYFIQSLFDGTYTIASGVISPAVSLLEGQRFMIVGSALNDGVYTYHATGIMNDDNSLASILADETFEGTVAALSVPRGVLDTVSDINDWLEKYGEAVNSPYQSENVIGVYSYTKATAGNAQSNGTNTATWQSVFKSRLDRWRKVSF